MVAIEITQTNSKFYAQSLILRNYILRQPIGQNLFDEDLSDEVNQVHFLALENNQLVGVVVLVPHYKKGVGKLRQMATGEEVRGKGYGIQLVKALEDYAADSGMTSIILHARHYAVGFYEKLGYIITSEVFQEVGMDHFVMEKKI